MTGAVLLGSILLVGGALIEWSSLPTFGPDDRDPPDQALLLRAARRRGFTSTSRLLQALGVVLVVIGILAMML